MTDLPRSLTWRRRETWLTSAEPNVEHAQAHEEGRAAGPWEDEAQALVATPREQRDATWFDRVDALMDAVQATPRRDDYPWHEPDDLDAIQAARPAPVAFAPWKGDDARYRERVHGALLGRIAGCMLGKPVEGWSVAEMRAWGEATGNWPLTDYFRSPTDTEAEAIRATGHHREVARWCRGALRDQLDGAIEDDDINYTVTGFAVVKQHGALFTPDDVARIWLQQIPVYHICTAERAAVRNFLNCIAPPQSASWRNPYREWIGAQIRADYFGYAHPGDPATAAAWAWRDACISHVQNGIYGEMWVAAMLAVAFGDDDWPTIIRAGLAQIPARCRLRAAIDRVLADYTAGMSYDDAVTALHQRWDEAFGHHWCHTISNAEIVALGLLYGENDYTTTISRAVMPGFDTDCNGATCGSLFGARFGPGAIPAKWADPLRDRAATGLAGYHHVSIRALAHEMADVADATR